MGGEEKKRRYGSTISICNNILEYESQKVWYLP